MQLQFVIDGQVQLSRVLLGISSTILDWTPAFAQSAEDLIEVFSYDVFESEGEAIDEVWAPLSPKYAIRKEKTYPGTGLLEATGLMRESFWSLVDPTSLTIGNAAEYFKYHQSTAPRMKIPRRAMLKLTENMREQIVKNFQTQLLEQNP
jgi:phage gpG-like protein